MVFRDYLIRAQVDLIDWQSNPDGVFKFILNYQDHFTKFCVLRALKAKTAEAVAVQLVDIFTLLGAPIILQSDNGREFCNQVINNLKLLWPELKIVHGKPRHSQSQGSIEQANRDVQAILTQMSLQHGPGFLWSEKLCFAQFIKNRTFHSGIKQTPFEALFGVKAQIGLSNGIFNISPEILDSCKTEEDLMEKCPELFQELNNKEFESLASSGLLEPELEEIQEESQEEKFQDGQPQELSQRQLRINRKRKLSHSGQVIAF